MEGYPQEEMQTIYHSSHLHALQLIPASDHGHHHTRCCDPTASAMINTNSSSSNPVYGCRPCNFYIHKNCAQLLPYVRHPSHPSHTLTLLPTSPYLQGIASCDGCWKQLVQGFSYHCTVCSFDLHTHCALLPPTINSPASHPHLLSLRFSDAFSFIIYKCDLCRGTIPAKAWLYCCAPCDFQAHTDCILARRGGSAAPRPAGQPPNPVTSGSAPAVWPGQVGAPNCPTDGQPSNAAGHQPNPPSGLKPAIWPGQGGTPSVSSGLDGGHDHATASAHGTQGNRFESHDQGGSVQANDVGNSTQAGAPEMASQQSGNDGGLSDFLALQRALMKFQLDLTTANGVNSVVSDYPRRPWYW